MVKKKKLNRKSETKDDLKYMVTLADLWGHNNWDGNTLPTSQPDSSIPQF